MHRATLELLAERPVEDVTLPLVAERAGVHPATLYRRWGTMPRLIEDLATDRLTSRSPLPDTGSLRGDLDAYTRTLVDDLASPVGRALVRAAALTTNQCASGAQQATGRYDERLVQIAAMLERARARGEATPSVQEFVEMLLLPVYARLLFSRTPPDLEYAQMLAERLMFLATARRRDQSATGDD